MPLLQIIRSLTSPGQDIVALPLMVFQEVDGPFMDALGMIGLLYWTTNVVNTLTCGYLQNGVTVMSPRLRMAGQGWSGPRASERSGSLEVS